MREQISGFVDVGGDTHVNQAPPAILRPPGNWQGRPLLRRNYARDGDVVVIQVRPHVRENGDRAPTTAMQCSLVMGGATTAPPATEMRSQATLFQNRDYPVLITDYPFAGIQRLCF